MNLSLARSLIAAARSEAERRSLGLAIAVVDAGGHLVAFERMDGVEWVAADVALGKAYTAAAFQTPSAVLAERSAAVPLNTRANEGSLSSATESRSSRPG